MRPTDEQLAAWRRLADAATEGPWTAQAHGALVTDATGEHHGAWEVTAPARGTVDDDADDAGSSAVALTVGTKRVADAILVAAAREAVPALLDEVARLRAVVDALPRCGCGALATRGEGVDVAPRPEWCEGCEAKWRAAFAKEAEAFKRLPGMRVVREEPSADVSYAAALRALLTAPPSPPGFDANGSPVE